MRSDWIVETAFGMGGLSPDATKALDALPETGAVTPLRYAPVADRRQRRRRRGVRPGDVADAVDLHATAGRPRRSWVRTTWRCGR